MAILVLLFCFVTLFFSLGVFINSTISKKELLLKTVLVFCGLLVLITEVLSLFYALNYLCISLCWIAVTVLNLFYLYLKKERFEIFYNNLKLRLKETYQHLKTRKFYEKCLLFSVLIILVLVFVQGIIYPPNNWDSMNYHLGRIPSWISHQSIAHYPTGAIRQIYQPPFAEYVILHFNILNKADYFSSTGQYLFLLFTVVGLLLIIENLGLSTTSKILCIFLAFTLPEIILQATSTQNDIVVAFFVVMAFYFALKSVQNFSLENAFFFGLAVGIGILTKGTAYVYMPAVLLIYGVTMFVFLFRDKKYNYVLYAVFAGLIFLSVNIGFYHRNYQLTSNLLGVDQKEYGTYSNEKMSTKLLMLSMIKNAGNHIGLLHFKPLSVVTAHAIMKLHKSAGVDIDDPATNYYKDKYDTLYNPDHEDAAPNLIHFILITIALIIIIVKSFQQKIPFPVKLLVFTIIFQGVFFSFYLKYQPFHTRLQTSLFLLAVPLICYAVHLLNINLKKLFYWSTPFIFAYALMIVLGNLNHPYNKIITKSRYEKYFVAKPWLYDEYNSVTQQVQKSNYQNIGLIMGDGDSDFEYALFTNCYSKPLKPYYINVDNYTKYSKADNGKIDCIIATAVNSPYIDYQGKRFYNQNLKNKFIHLYR